jgi:cytochrome c-type biogenesis protein CcmF
MAPALFLMGVAPLARWKKAELPELAVRLRWALGVAVAMALIVPFAMGRFSALVGFGIWLAVWIMASAAATLMDRVKRASGAEGVFNRLRQTPRAYYGMLLAHVGIAVFVIGVTLVKGYEAEKDVRMRAGDTTELGGYTFRMSKVEDVQGPNYAAVRATMEVTRAGSPIAVLYPEKRVYRVQDSPMTEAGIATGPTRDLYVSLGDQLDAATWLVRVQVKPFVVWIWGGCVIMALGGLLAASDRRYRVTTRIREMTAAAAPAEGRG